MKQFISNYCLGEIIIALRSLIALQGINMIK